MGAAVRGPSGLIDLGAEPLTIGRSRNNRLVLTNSQISSKHAEIQPLGGGRYQVVDVGSTNGTAVNGVKLGSGMAQPLNAGDTITLGGSGGIELRFELTADAPWQAGQPQAPTIQAGAPMGAAGGFGMADQAAPPAQPFGGGIGQPPPGAAGFPPPPAGFGPPGQSGPGPQPFPPPQDAFAAPPSGFPPPNQFGGPPGAVPTFPQPGGPGGFDALAGAPPAAGFPPPGGPGAAPFGGPPGQAPGFPPPGGPPFGAAPQGGYPPPGGQPFGAPGGPPGAGPGYPPPGGQPFGAPGYPPPGGAMPVKKRTGRNIFLLAGSILVLVLIVGGIVYGAMKVLHKNSPSSTPVPTPKLTPAPTPTAHEPGALALLASSTPLSAERAEGQKIDYRVTIHLTGDAAALVAVVSKI